MLAGIGGVGIGIGMLTGLIAIDKKGTVRQHCDPDPSGGVACRDQEGIDAAATGRTMSTVSTIGFAAGAATLALGVVFVATSGGKSGAITAIAPRALPGGAGLSIARSF